ncbi:MAG: hypothetical protein A2Z15_09485 [Chloroflexi bacterium RBG_16_50_11]|nr:MAG: hypothetical protein A2Z15_09485 [Chloroflexi bacterium RBG_16_50_11]
MPAKNYDKYILKEPMAKSMFEQIKAPQILMLGEKNFNGAYFSMGWSYVTEPFLMVDEPHFHDYEQYIGFVGGNLNNMKDFDAEIELYFGEEGTKKVINCTTFVWVPKGLIHGPLKITRVKKPFLFVDIVLGPKPDYRRKPANTKV